MIILRSRDVVALNRNQQKCKEAEQMSASDCVNQDKGLIDVHMSEAKKKLASYVGILFLDVYTDATRLALSAFSWPARYIASEARNRFDFNSNTVTIPTDINMQYVNPSSHLDLLKIITQSHHEEFKEKIETTLAYSLCSHCS